MKLPFAAFLEADNTAERSTRTMASFMGMSRVLPLFLMANVFSLLYVTLVHMRDPGLESGRHRRTIVREEIHIIEDDDSRSSGSISSRSGRPAAVPSPPKKKAEPTECKDVTCLQLPLQSGEEQQTLTEAEMVAGLQLRYPNIAFEYLYERSLLFTDKPCKRETCSCLPEPHDIKINNEVWQEFRPSQSDITMFLYSAYLDIRPANPHPCIRILTAISKPKMPNQFMPWCQLWLEDEETPVVVKSSDYKFLGWDGYFDPDDDSLMNTPYMFHCQLPAEVIKSKKVIQAVTFVENKCDVPSNALTVMHNKADISKQQNDVAICVKGLEFPYEDLTVRMIEWIELMKEMKAAKISVYYLKLHQNMFKMFKHYEQDGFVDLNYFPLSGNQPNSWLHQHYYLKNRFTSHIRHEKLAQHDCFYRHMYAYKYVAVIDPDEVILPLLDPDWPNLLHRTEYLTKRLKVTNHPAGYRFRHTYVFDNLKPHPVQAIDDVPKDFHILRHLFRTNITVGKQAKTICRTDQVIKLNSHKPDLCFTGDCNNVWVKSTVGRLNHYRHGCVSNITRDFCDKMQQNLVEDRLLLNYKKPILERAFNVLKAIGVYNLTKN